MLTANVVPQNGNYEKYYTAAVFDENVFEKAVSLFKDYRSSGVILNDDFTDNEWKLTNQLYTTTISFRFDELAYHRNAAPWIGCDYDLFIMSVKAYAMLRMGSTAITNIRDVVNIFRMFLELPEATLSNAILEQASHMAEFLAALPGESIRRDVVLESLEERKWNGQVRNRKVRQRVLADFSSYFKFNDAMLELWGAIEETEKLLWFPLYLWWKLTAILPLRTTEFLLTPRKCLSYENGETLITLRRTLQKGRNRKFAYRVDKDYETVRYVITDNMAREITWYQEATSTMEPTALSTLFVREPHYAYFKRTSLPPLGYYTYSNLATCLRRFQDNVMGFDLESKISLGDTRHLAMISLILSGGSPLVCKELAGHDDINISAHYYSNISSFIECATLEMHRKSRAWKAELINRGTQMTTAAAQRIPVQEGFCDSEAYGCGDITDCIKSIGADGELGNCHRCTHYIDGNSGVHFLYACPSERKEQVEMDTQYLLQSLEAVRRGIGLQEDIQSALLRLQQSGAWYSRSLQNDLEVNGNGKTKKNIN